MLVPQTQKEQANNAITPDSKILTLLPIIGRNNLESLLTITGKNLTGVSVWELENITISHLIGVFKDKKKDLLLYVSVDFYRLLTGIYKDTGLDIKDFEFISNASRIDRGKARILDEKGVKTVYDIIAILGN